MAKRKIVYQNWIVDIGIDPGQIGNLQIIGDKVQPNEKIILAVREALKKLTVTEQEFIEKYYFQGMTYLEISKVMNKRISKIEGLHLRSTNKLKKFLAEFVKEYFGFEANIGQDCLICQSVHKSKINKLIKAKKKCETWKQIIRRLKSDYQLSIKTPQILIGHQKYHMK